MNKKKNKLPRFELVLGENELISGVHAIAFVKSPAHEENWVAFNDEKLTEQKFNEDKMIVTGPALVPNVDIYRKPNAENPDGFYVHFDEETIEKCKELFLKRNQNHGTNVNHTNEIFEGVELTESWTMLDADNDKANALGFDLPKGTWMCSWKISDEDLWAKVKSGEVMGMSIEGFFIEELIEMNRASLSDDEKMDRVNNILGDENLSEVGKMRGIDDLLK